MPPEDEIEKPDAPETPAAPDPFAALNARLDAVVSSQNEQIAAMRDTVAAALSASRPMPSGGPGIDPANITPQLRHALRQKGLTDADINNLAPSIMPFVEVLAPELIGLVEQRTGGLDERLSAKELEDDSESFPHAKLLRKERRELIAQAKKEGRMLSQEAAYHTAVSLNLDKVSEAQATARASSRGADAAATSGIGHRTAASGGRRAAPPSGPTTKADLTQMSHAERMKFYEDNGDVPLQ